MAHDPKLSSEAATTAAAAVVALANGGIIRIYDGAKPATADTEPTQNEHVLSEHLLSNPAAVSVEDGVAVFDTIADDTDAKATGVATWFRCFKADGESPLFDGTVGVKNSGCDLEMPTVNIQQHATVSITSFIYRAPKSQS